MSTTCRCGAISFTNNKPQKMRIRDIRRYGSLPLNGMTHAITEIAIRDFAAVEVSCVGNTSHIMVCRTCEDRFEVVVRKGVCVYRQVDAPLVKYNNMKTVSERLPLQLRPFVEKQRRTDEENDEDEESGQFDMDEVFSPITAGTHYVGSFYDCPFVSTDPIEGANYH